MGFSLFFYAVLHKRMPVFPNTFPYVRRVCSHLSDFFMRRSDAAEECTPSKHGCAVRNMESAAILTKSAVGFSETAAEYMECAANFSDRAVRAKMIPLAFR